MRSDRTRDIWAIVVIALVVRVLGVFVSQHYLYVVADDTVAYYYPIARSLIAGTGFTVHGSAVDASRIAPVFPVWLSALMMVGGTNVPAWAIGLGNAVLRTGGCVALYLLTRRYFGRRAAIFAAGLYIFDPWETFWVGYVLKESLAVPLLLLAVLLAADIARDGLIRQSFVVGAAIGLATLTRFPSIALWGVAAVCIVAVVRETESPWRRRAATGIGVMSFSLLATLSPWLVRNWLVVGRPVLSTRFVGQKLYTSNGPGVQVVTDGYYAPAGIDPRVIASGDERRAANEDAQLTRLTLTYVREHPGEIPGRLVGKIINMWRPTFEGHSRRNTILLAIPYVVLMLVSLAGIVVAFRERLTFTALAATLVIFFAVHLVFRGEIRNRQYLMPILYAFGGLAGAQALGRLERRDVRAA